MIKPPADGYNKKYIIPNIDPHIPDPINIQ